MMIMSIFLVRLCDWALALVMELVMVNLAARYECHQLINQMIIGLMCVIFFKITMLIIFHIR